MTIRKIILALLFGWLVGAAIHEARANILCGIPPIPPVGCEVAYCLCDADNNCRWVFRCE